MATCKDCLYWEACNEYRGAFWGHKAQYSSPIINASADSCIFYKDRSRFVELPCNINDVIYRIKAKQVIKSRVNRFEIDWLGVKLVAVRRIGLGWSDEFGTKLFLTREEAEQALKEKEEKENG